MDGYKGGWIEIIAGGMFSGKSEELIRRLRRALIARQRVQVFKPILDNRFATDDIVSRDDRRLKAIAVTSSNELLTRVEIGVQVVGIDEVQFFDAGVVDVCMQLADAGVRVIAAGLDQDYLRRPFGPMPALLAVAEEVSRCTPSAFAAVVPPTTRSASPAEMRRSRLAIRRTKPAADRATRSTKPKLRKTSLWCSSPSRSQHDISCHPSERKVPFADRLESSKF